MKRRKQLQVSYTSVPIKDFFRQIKAVKFPYRNCSGTLIMRTLFLVQPVSAMLGFNRYLVRLLKDYSFLSQSKKGLRKI